MYLLNRTVKQHKVFTCHTVSNSIFISTVTLIVVTVRTFTFFTESVVFAAINSIADTTLLARLDISELFTCSQTSGMSGQFSRSVLCPHHRSPRPVMGIALLYGDGVCFL
jgi:hypothetical protein